MTNQPNQCEEQISQEKPGNEISGPPPNIIVILVDELRYPTVPYPEGVNSPDEYIKAVMPKTHKWIWEDGVKFSNYIHCQ